MPDATSRDRFLGEMVTSIFSGASDISYALPQMSSPAVRLETLQRLGKGGRLDAEKITDAQLSNGASPASRWTSSSPWP